MWPVLAFTVALIRMATSKSEPLDLRTAYDARELRLNSLNDRPILEFNGNSPRELPALIPKYYNNPLVLQKLSALDDLDLNRLENIEEQTQPAGDVDDAEMSRLSTVLTKLLQEPGNWEAPLVLLEEPAVWGETEERPEAEELESSPTVWKRSRYYRRYPWKRQNSRSRSSYDYDASHYLCTPTRDDVFRLLVALHDARQGNKSRTVNFCNRRRPAGSIFTNLRFLGRRK